MRKNKLDPQIHISSDQNIKKSIIIGIFNANTMVEGSLSSDIYENVDIEPNKEKKSVIYCEGHFIINSPLKSETIHTRYKKVKKLLSENNLKRLK